MSTTSKNKLLTWLVILLVIVNTVTLIIFWLDKSNHPKKLPNGTPFDFLVKELNFNSTQQHEYKKLMLQHRSEADRIREEIKKSKTNFFNLLKDATVTDSIKNTAATSANNLTTSLDVLTFNHFQKVRSLCTAEQQKKFDNIIEQVMHMMGPADHPPGPPPNMKDDNRPPPPQE